MKLKLWRQLNPYAIASFSRASVQAVSLFAMLVAVTSSDLATFGAFSVAWVTTVIATAVMYSGFYEYLLRTIAVEDEKHSVFWLLLMQGFILSLVAIGIGAAVYGATGGQLRTFFFALSPIPILVAPMAWCDALLVRKGRVAAVAVVLLLAEATGFAVLSVALHLGYGYQALVAWRLAATCVTLIALVTLSEGLPRFRFSIEASKRAIKAAWPLQGNTITGTLSNYGADFLLAGYLSPAAAGAYRAASRIAVTSTDIFYQPMRPINWSIFARLERETDVPGMRRVYLSHLAFLAVIVWPILVCLALFSGRILNAFMKPDWAAVASTLSLLAIARVFGILDFFLDPVLVCTGRARTQFLVRTSFGIVLLAGIAILARYSPAVVAAWQISVSFLLGATAIRLICTSLNVPVWDVLASLLHGAVMAGVCAIAADFTFYAVDLSPKLRLVAAAVAAALCLFVGLKILTRLQILRFPRP